MSAIDDRTGEAMEPVQVLITLHPGFDMLDFAGPLEVLSIAQHDPKNKATQAFEITIAAAQQGTQSEQNCSVKADIDFEEAHDRLSEFDILIVPGGNSAEVLKQNSEPIQLIEAYGKLQASDSSKERTLLCVCTGSLFAAQAGVLQGMAATTHPDFYTKLEILCQQASRKGDLAGTDVMEERYVVNNARFDLGENEDENPYVVRKMRDGRRMSIAGKARRGSTAWKESNKRRESNARRANLRLGGLRVITSGGITSGLDASLYLVGAMVSHDSALEVARILQYDWRKGVTVDGIDV